MYGLKSLLVLFLFLGFSIPAYAAVNGVETSSCSVFSEAEADKAGEAAEEEEPDCE